VWDFIFPYRPLKLKSNKVRALAANNNEFSAAEMSDGERVGLYLIGQTILAEKDCVLVIDEPELHLHKSLMVRLWNKLEEYRKDCTFVYITHDLDFAVSKPSSKLIWIQEYNGNFWKWVEVNSNEIIPDNLYLELLGSHKPILFIEGEKGSLDAQIYQAYYSDFTIIPRGSCEKVIESVRGLRCNKQIHGKEVYGLIDRDFRPEEQLRSLQNEGIWSIPVNQVENLFLDPEIITLTCKYLGINSEKEIEIISAIKQKYDKIKNQINSIASKSRLLRVLNEEFSSIKDEEQYQIFKDSINKRLDQEFASIKLPDKEESILEILKIYPYKGLVREMQGIIDLRNDGYRNLVLSFFESEKRQALLNIFAKYLPDILH
jgi:hypothetical protein